MAPSNTKTPVLYALGGMVITGITIDIGLGGLVLLYIAASYAIEYSFSALTEPLIATAISLPMIGLAILGLFFGVWLLKRGGTTNIEMVGYIVLSILLSIFACPFITRCNSLSALLQYSTVQYSKTPIIEAISKKSSSNGKFAASATHKPPIEIFPRLTNFSIACINAGLISMP